MNSKKTIVRICISIFTIGSLLLGSCDNTNQKQEEQTADKNQIDTLKNYIFQTPDSVLKERIHWFVVDGWKFEAEIIEVADKRVRVYNEEYQKEFEFPLALLREKRQFMLKEWQAYNDLNKPVGEIVRDTGRYELQIVNIPLKEIDLKIEFTYRQKNRDRANHMLVLLKRAIPDYEKKSGIPFPGFNPFMVLENLELKSLGLAGPTDAYLCSLDKASEWTLLHEFVHIWNSGGGPAWVSEGLADYIAYQGMIVCFYKKSTIYF